MNRAIEYSLGLLFCLVFVAGSANASAQEWLQKMVTAAQTTDYQGSFLYARGSDIQLMKIRHRLINGIREERIWHINGAPLEVIRKDNILSCLHPANSNISLEHTIPSGPFSQIFENQFQAGLKYYQVEQVGNDRVAEKDAILLVVMPKEPNRYTYRLWLEMETFLLLRSETIDLNMNILEQFQFVDLDLAPQFSAEDFTPQWTLGGESHQEFIPQISETEMSFKMLDWMASWLPTGYELKASENQIESDDKSELEQMLSYSDGLSSFSIFIESKSMGMPEAENIYGATSIVTRHANDVSMTLIGEIPILTAEKILTSIRRVQ